MNNIPITFEYKGKEYKGFLSEVFGAGSAGNVWYLMINNYYHGQLHFINGEFKFFGNDGRFEDIANVFGEQVMLWYE